MYLKDNIKNNEIEIALKIEEKDVNNNIYFLDNVDYVEYKRKKSIFMII